MVTPLKTEVLTHMKAKYSILALQTAEEARAIQMVKDICADPKTVKRTMYIGSITKGLYEADNEKNPDGSITMPMQILNLIEGQQIQKGAVPSVYVLLDMNLHIQNDPNVRRKLRDLHALLKSKASTIILIDPQTEVHAELQKVVTVFDMPLPDKMELEEIFCTRIANLKEQVRKLRDEQSTKPERADSIQRQLEALVPTTEKLIKQATENKDAIIAALQGLTSIEADNVVAKNIVLKELSISTILQEKKQIVKKSGALDYWETDETQENIGGLKNLKAWSRSARNRFSEKARKYGLIPPKGVCLIGAPGTGKSLSAKAMSNLFGVPLLTLTMAQMTSKYYGETGNRMMSAIRLAQAMSPCIVLIDEIEKAFGTGGNQEHEESARTRGALLTAMEESTGIFWLATCNQPELLAPELIARFPVIFHVDLPAPDERKEIFAIHLTKVKRDPAKFDMERLVASSEGYVGREIRNAIQEALGSAFDQNTEVNTDHIISALRTITPTAVQRKEDIDRIRRWCDRNARPASDSKEAKTATTAREEILNRDLEF